MTGLLRDLRYAVRTLARRPGFSLTAILTLALGIGAVTALFGVTDRVLLRPLDWPEGDRLVRLSETRQGGTNRLQGILTNGTYLAWAEQPSTLESLAAWTSDTLTLRDAGEPVRLEVAAVTPSLFPLLRATPLHGAAFGPTDDRSPAVILSHGLWMERFGGSLDALGRAIDLDGRSYRVVAVMPGSFAFPDREIRAWTPFSIQPVIGDDPDTRSLSMFAAIGRLRDGVSPAQVAAEGTARGREAPDPGMVAMAVFGSRGPVEVRAEPLLASMTSSVRPAILVLLAAVGLLLLAATANVAGLQLARAASRRREIAIRLALGARSGRIGRLLIVESLVLGLAGCLVGLFLAAALLRSLPWLLPAGLPRLDDVALDARAAIFAMGASVVTAVAFGLIPLLQARHVGLVSPLAEGGRGPVAGGRGTAQARALIMAGQVAVACVLLIGASLLARSFVALLDADRGYDPTNVLTAKLVLPDSFFTPERRVEVLDRLLERMRTGPEVREAAIGSVLPLTRGEALMALTLPSEPEPVHTSVRSVSPGYFGALRIPVLQGRALSDGDRPGAPPAVVVNRTFARNHLGEAPIGTLLPLALDPERPDCEVVGVVDDVRHRGANDVVQPEIYWTYRQRSGGYGSSEAYLVVRTASSPASEVPRLRTIAREIDTSLVLESVLTMEDRLWRSLSAPRLWTLLLGGFACFALIIVGVGLFGVLSYSVAQRGREIAVRSALGATRGDIVRLVARQGLIITALGLGTGMIAALWLVRFLTGLLFGVTPHDKMSFLVVPLILLAVALIACIAPARRAARVSPQQVLRAG